MSLWQWWIIAGVILLILEIFTQGFVLVCFGVACFITAIASFIGCDIKLQIIIFSVSNIIIFVGLRPFFLRYLSPHKEHTKTNTDALIGKAGIVTETINPDTSNGRVKVGGEDWKAISDDGNSINMGQKVIVKRVEGAKLFVELKK